MTVKNVFEISVFILCILEEPRQNIQKNIPFFVFIHSVFLFCFSFPWLRLWDSDSPVKMIISILIYPDVLLAFAAPSFISSFTTLFTYVTLTNMHWCRRHEKLIFSPTQKNSKNWSHGIFIFLNFVEDDISTCRYELMEKINILNSKFHFWD